MARHIHSVFFNTLRLQTTLLALITSLFWASQSHSAALGEATLHSKLGEPLNISIELLGAQDLLTDEIYVTVKAVDKDPASDAALRNASIEVLERPAGKLVLVRGNSPMREPYLHFSVKLQQAQGNITRDYVLILDL